MKTHLMFTRNLLNGQCVQSTYSSCGMLCWMSGSNWMQRTMRIKTSTFNILIVCVLIIILFSRFMKSFCIKAAVYQQLHKKHPQFTHKMKKMERKQKYEKEFISVVCCFLFLLLSWRIQSSYQLNHASHRVRSDDSNGLLTKGLEYVNEKCRALTPPISASRLKAEVQGFNHPMIARLLCPINYKTSFDQDPERYALSVVLQLILLFFQVSCQSFKWIYQDLQH